MPAAKKPKPKEPKPKKSTPKKPSAKKPAVPGSAMPPQPGDVIVIDSSKVGSPPREGEVLEVIHGEVRVSYRVQWPDGHQSLIAPALGSARIKPGSDRA